MPRRRSRPQAGAATPPPAQLSPPPPPLRRRLRLLRPKALRRRRHPRRPRTLPRYPRRPQRLLAAALGAAGSEPSAPAPAPVRCRSGVALGSRVERRGPRAVARRPAAGRRARPRPRLDTGHRQGRPDHARRRARVHRPRAPRRRAAVPQAAPRRACTGTGAAAVATAPPAGPARAPGGRPPRTRTRPVAGAARRGRAVHEHPAPHRRAHGPVEGDLGAHPCRDRGRLRGYRPGSQGRTRTGSTRRRGSVSPTSPSSPAPWSRRCATTRS